MEEVTAVSAEIELPADALVTSTMLVVSYIGADGKTRYAWQAGGGDQPRTTAIGLLEIIKHDLLVGNADA